MKKIPNFKLNVYNSFETDLEILIQKFKNKNIPINLYLNSNQKLYEKSLLKKRFQKIDEVIGLQYPFLLKKKLLFGNDHGCLDSHDENQIIALNTPELLEEWVNVYCSSFNICFEKKLYIFGVLKQNFKFFKFILYKIFTCDKPFGDTAGCCLLFSYRDCVALYCLGTLQKYRNRHIATKIIDFSISFAQRNGYRIFGLQTLQSDDLIYFYKKKGFVIVYRNTIYQMSSR